MDNDSTDPQTSPEDDTSSGPAVATLEDDTSSDPAAASPDDDTSSDSAVASPEEPPVAAIADAEPDLAGGDGPVDAVAELGVDAEEPVTGDGADSGDAPGPPASDDPRPTYFGGVQDVSRGRLLELGVLEPVESPDEAALMVLSTRMRRSDASAAMAVAKVRKLPVVVLTHTGGESNAVEIMRSGGAVVVAEGNENALLPYLSGGAADSGMLETYERRVGTGSTLAASGEHDDAATGLPGLAAFEERIEQLTGSGELPRLAFLEVQNLVDGVRLSLGAVALLRRRLAMQYLALTRNIGAELYILGDNKFGMIAVGVSPNRAETLAHQLTRVTESFAPSGVQPLLLAVGHAGPEVASELPTVRELASRATLVAAEAGVSRVVGADSLSLGVAATTELEAALRIIEVVERNDAYEPGHGGRVAALASDIARQLGFEPNERLQVRVAAHLADIGKISLPPRAMGDPERMEPAQLTMYESHPQRGADYVRTSAGDAVADAIRAHHERWDGTGFPAGISGNDIPIVSRIIAVADLWDQLTHHDDESRQMSAAAAAGELRAESGSGLDPAVVEAALTLVGDGVLSS